jgi:L-rhamnose-H+ transport protein
MNESAWIGAALVLMGGAMTGSFALPMKFARRWQWENIWLLYSIVGLLLIPWLAAFLTVPGLGAVYQEVPARTVWATGLFGFGWGVANVLFGISVALIGMALTFAIVGGMSAAFGSLIPLVLLTTDRLSTRGGRLVLLGVGLTVGGVAALGTAGRIREKARKQEGSPQAMRAGLLLCIVSGLLAPMLNFSFAFGSGIAANAVKHGATGGNSAHAIWTISLFGGFIGNGGYAILKLARNRTWHKFKMSGIGAEWEMSTIMGVLFTLGFLLYGRGATALGDLGPAVGWPVFQATTMMVSTGVGAASGEWRNAGSRFVGLTCLGLALLVGAVVVLSIGNRM